VPQSTPATSLLGWIQGRFLRLIGTLQRSLQEKGRILLALEPDCKTI
jgi:hypothetical protein